MVRILVDGEGSRAVELCIRAALGDRANEGQWLISAVKLPARWVVSFLVSPEDRLGGYSWCGPAHQVRSALEEALASAGMQEACFPLLSEWEVCDLLDTPALAPLRCAKLHTTVSY